MNDITQKLVSDGTRLQQLVKRPTNVDPCNRNYYAFRCFNTNLCPATWSHFIQAIAYKHRHVIAVTASWNRGHLNYTKFSKSLPNDRSIAAYQF